jgi:hypothetical protein
MDFMSDQLFNGRPIRILTVVDIHTREGLSTHPRANFRAAQVVEVLDQLVRLRANRRARGWTMGRCPPVACSTIGLTCMVSRLISHVLENLRTTRSSRPPMPGLVPNA